MKAAALCAAAAWLAGCAAPPPQAPSLAGTRWQLAAIESMDDAQGTTRPDDPARYTLDFGTDGRATLRLDCNRAMAAYTVDATASSLAFGPVAGTRAMCLPGSLEPRLVKALPYVRHYLVKDGRLHLTLMADGGILSWSPRP